MRRMNEGEFVKIVYEDRVEGGGARESPPVMMDQ